MNKRILFTAFFGIILAAAVLFGVYVYACEDDWCFLFEWQKVHSVHSFAECAGRGYPIMETYPRQCALPDGRTFAEPPPANTEANIRVTAPSPSETVGTTVHIHGEARVFENQVTYRIRDEDGTILVEGPMMAAAPDVGLFGVFDLEALYKTPKGKTGTVEVFDYSAKDGSEENMVSVPVRF